MNNFKRNIAPVILEFLGYSQKNIFRAFLKQDTHDEAELQKWQALGDKILIIPKLSAEDYSTVHLHYIGHKSEWFINAMQDVNDEDELGAEGCGVIHGHYKGGYIDIAQLIEHGAELDLEFDSRQYDLSILLRGK